MDGVGADSSGRGAEPGEWDRVLASLAAAQHGVVSTVQLRRAGLTTRAIGLRVRRHQLHRLYPGVYAVGHRLLSPRGWWMAAVLACGEGALLSHRAAAALWGLIDGSPRVVDVLSLRSQVRRRGVRVRRVRDIEARDRASRDGIACTSVARTLLDIATVLDARALDRAVRRSEDLRLFDRFAVEEVLGRRRSGTVALRSAVESFAKDHGDGLRTKSELEIRFLELLRRHGFVMPSTNVVVETPWAAYEVDNFWPGIGLVIETDGWETHRDRRSFQRDHEKAADLKAGGYEFLWLTWTQVVDGEAGLVERLDRLIPRVAPTPRAETQPSCTA